MHLDCEFSLASNYELFVFIPLDVACTGALKYHLTKDKALHSITITLPKSQQQRVHKDGLKSCDLRPPPPIHITFTQESVEDAVTESGILKLKVGKPVLKDT